MLVDDGGQLLQTELKVCVCVDMLSAVLGTQHGVAVLQSCFIRQSASPHLASCTAGICTAPAYCCTTCSWAFLLETDIPFENGAYPPQHIHASCTCQHNHPHALFASPPRAPSGHKPSAPPAAAACHAKAAAGTRLPTRPAEPPALQSPARSSSTGARCSECCCFRRCFCRPPAAADWQQCTNRSSSSCAVLLEASS